MGRTRDEQLTPTQRPSSQAAFIPGAPGFLPRVQASPQGGPEGQSSPPAKGPCSLLPQVPALLCCGRAAPLPQGAAGAGKAPPGPRTHHDEGEHHADDEDPDPVDGAANHEGRGAGGLVEDLHPHGHDGPSCRGRPEEGWGCRRRRRAQGHHVCPTGQGPFCAGRAQELGDAGQRSAAVHVQSSPLARRVWMLAAGSGEAEPPSPPQGTDLSEPQDQAFPRRLSLEASTSEADRRLVLEGPVHVEGRQPKEGTQLQSPPSQPPLDEPCTLPRPAPQAGSAVGRSRARPSSPHSQGADTAGFSGLPPPPSLAPPQLTWTHSKAEHEAEEQGEAEVGHPGGPVLEGKGLLRGAAAGVLSCCRVTSEVTLLGGGGLWGSSCFWEDALEGRPGLAEAQRAGSLPAPHACCGARREPAAEGGCRLLGWPLLAPACCTRGPHPSGPPPAWLPTLNLPTPSLGFP